MEAIYVYIIIAVISFTVVFITKKRFGLLGLTLAAGSMMSVAWTGYAERLVSYVGIIGSPMVSTTIALAIVLAPSIVLLLHGHTNKTLIGRIVSATLFSVLATVLLIEPMSRVFIPQSVGVDIYNLVLNNRSLIISICLTVAVIDLFFTKPASTHEKKSKH